MTVKLRLFSTSTIRAFGGGGKNFAKTTMISRALHAKKVRAGRQVCPTTRNNDSRKSFWAARSRRGIHRNDGRRATCGIFFRRPDSRRKSWSCDRMNIPTRKFFAGVATHGNGLKKAKKPGARLIFADERQRVVVSRYASHLMIRVTLFRSRRQATNGNGLMQRRGNIE